MVITDHSINRAISHLRKVFGDDPKKPDIIETIPKIGYRLISPVKVIEENAGEPESRQTADQIINQLSNRTIFKWISIPATILLLTLLFWMVRQEPVPGIRGIDSRPSPLTTQLGHERFYLLCGRRLAFCLHP